MHKINPRLIRRIQQTLVCLVLVILFSSSALLGAFAAYSQNTLRQINRAPKRTLKNAEKEMDLDFESMSYDKDIVNILLIGADKRSDEHERGRSDTTMIATINKKEKTLKLTSLMRDMYIDIPGYGMHKFNAAYSYGGVELEYQTIANAFGIKLDGYVEVDMEAFRDVIDYLGGVQIELSEGEADFLKRAYQNSKHGEKDVKAGMNNLTAYQTLAYCRIRQDASGEYGRTDRQRKVLISLYKSLKKEDIQLLSTTIYRSMKYITTDLDDKTITELLMSVLYINTDEIQQLRIPYEGSYEEGRLDEGNGPWVIQVDYEKNREALNYFIFGEGDDPHIKDEYGIENNNFDVDNMPEKTEGISTY